MEHLPIYKPKLKELRLAKREKFFFQLVRATHIVLLFVHSLDEVFG